MKVTLLTLYNEPFSAIGQLCVESLNRHAPEMDCSVIVHDELFTDKLAPSWNKIIAVFGNLLGDSDWIMWMDADCILGRPFDLKGFLEKQPDFTCVIPSHDDNGICMGVFAARNSKWTLDFLNTLLVCGDVVNPDRFGKGFGIKWEQNTTKTLVEEFPLVAAHFGKFDPEIVTLMTRDDPDWIYPIHHHCTRSYEVRIADMVAELENTK